MPRSNILFALADDWSWPHASVYGDKTVKLPAFERLTAEGVVFTHTFCCVPSCTPSRAGILTGQMPHRLEESANLQSILRPKYKTFPDILEEAGYFVGRVGKGCAPGSVEYSGRERDPAGPHFDDFEQFLAAVPPNKPFCLWFGSKYPHRNYPQGSGLKAGLKLGDVQVPPYLPDTQEVRSDIVDYYHQVELFDRQVQEMLEALDRSGHAENTIVVVTSDNGWPFPRAKANLYDAGTRMPMAIRWPAKVSAGWVTDEFIGHTDLAPTFLEAAGIEPLPEMTGRSFLDLLTMQKPGNRDTVFVERERHAQVRRGNLGYPSRAIRTRKYLYVRNFRPDRWPAGDPDYEHVSQGVFGDIDKGPSKWIVARPDDPEVEYYYRLACEKRPAEELYDVVKDPWQLVNVAENPEYADAKKDMREKLDRWMLDTEDQRATVDDDRWDEQPFYVYDKPPYR